MKIGRMNNPEMPLGDEIRWTAEHGFDYIDLTIEPPRATLQDLSACDGRRLLQDLKLGVIGHSAYYIPIQSPIKAVREACLSEFLRLLEAFKDLGADRMAVHFNAPPPLLDRNEVTRAYLEVLTPLCERARKMDMVIILENTFGGSHQIEFFTHLTQALPDLHVLLDIAHANLERQWDAMFIYMKDFAKRIRHVHLSENDGNHDQHLPFGVVPRGRMDWPKILHTLKRHGYDGSITLEVFSPDRRYILGCKEMLLEWWNA